LRSSDIFSWDVQVKRARERIKTKQSNDQHQNRGQNSDPGSDLDSDPDEDQDQDQHAAHLNHSWKTRFLIIAIMLKNSLNSNQENKGRKGKTKSDETEKKCNEMR
jgi:hypothetical protein